MDQRVDLTIAAIFVAVGSFIVFHASSIPVGRFADGVGPRVFFYVCATVMIVGGLALIGQRLLQWNSGSNTLVANEGAEDEPGYPSSSVRPLVQLALFIAYALAFNPLGYLISTPLYIFAALYALGRRNWPWMILIALSTTLIFYLSFATFLGVRMSVGPFTELFRHLGWIII